jgi:protein-tyrosine phosphatase
MIDLHTHLIPGVDDGAQDLAAARGALGALHEAGVREFVATPHVDGSQTLRPATCAGRLRELDEGWVRLTEMAAAEFPGQVLHRGAEIMLDVPDPDLSDPRLRLSGGHSALVEFPFMAVPPNAGRALAGLVRQGFTPVLAHPERYVGRVGGVREAEEWRESGAVLQVNAGSLVGRYGREAQRRAWELLSAGLAAVVASDFHGRGEPWIREAVAALADAGGEAQARLLLETNPGRILRGEPPLPVAPVERHRSLWRRFSETVLRG